MVCTVGALVATMEVVVISLLAMAAALLVTAVYAFWIAGGGCWYVGARGGRCALRVGGSGGDGTSSDGGGMPTTATPLMVRVLDITVVECCPCFGKALHACCSSSLVLPSRQHLIGLNGCAWVVSSTNFWPHALQTVWQATAYSIGPSPLTCHGWVKQPHFIVDYRRSWIKS